MTKTAKAVNQTINNSNGIVKKTPKCAKVKLTISSSAAATVKKKMLAAKLTKEQEASIAETITFVVSGKVRKTPTGSPSVQDVPKLWKRVAKNKPNTHIKDTTAKKTAPHAKTKVAKKQVNNVHRLARPKLVNKTVNRPTKCKKPNRGEIKNNKAESKSSVDVSDKEEKHENDKKPTKNKQILKTVKSSSKKSASHQGKMPDKLNGEKTSVKKDVKVTEAKVMSKKVNQKLQIKEEQLDEVIAAIFESSVKAEGEKLGVKKSSEKRTPKLEPSVLANKLKAKLKSAPLKNKVVYVKNKNHKAKLVGKPIQQVKSRKLLSIWNGPKRHRVASLNAMAKVHCLYDNEFRGNFDQLELNVKRELAEEKEEKRRTRPMKHERQSVSPQPTRTLRSVPGLRAVGKMWDMHDTTSSSEDDYLQVPARSDKPKKTTKAVPTEKRTTTVAKTKKPLAKRRKKEEVVMDLKDMVVRKRMASLNASAILAASYSAEKRTHPRGANSDTETSTSEDEYSSDDETIKKEEKIDCKLQVRAVPSKKVAVILNQDTDVTFTGVYMNSTTRSTHHEGYCHIAGMKYRISATSHTQTAATAVSTETILQSSTTTTRENENADTTPAKSYTPLDALSNMQPPANAVQPHNHHLPPPPLAAAPPSAPMQPHHHHHHQHVHHAVGDIGSLARRHGCSTSAFSAPPPPATGGCGTQTLHHMPPEHGYVQGYYQPAGPLISVHGHSQAPPSLNTKSVPLSDASPSSTSPLLQPPPPSSAGDSSDSEVIITSVTTAKEALAQQQPSPAAAYHRLNHHYPPPPPHGAYSAYGGAYPPQYYGAPPPPPGPTAYPHHDMCYTSFQPHKYMFRRYLAPPAPPYYQPSSPDLYTQQPNTNQQVVTATSSSSGNYQSSSTGPPPPTLMETYPGPPPTLIESYPSPAHYYQGYGPTPPCYTHSAPARPLSYINATYQTCPCPMQSCPKNVHTGPLAGDSKRSNITIAKESVPLPPVALALPLEPASATGPPSPARGSAGMPPPPSPAGATYQQPPPPKQETPEPAAIEQRRKARVGKAMVRHNIAQNQQNTMLLMCQTPTILESVKREVESPKEEAPVTAKIEDCADVVLVAEHENAIKRELPEKPRIGDMLTDQPPTTPPPPDPEIPPAPANDDLLLPCQKTVAENVKVKNMKRKCSMSKETVPPLEPVAVVAKKPKLEKPNGSYKDLIKKTQNVVKINNGKRKLITETRTVNGVLIRFRKSNKRNKRLASAAAAQKEEHHGKRVKSTKPLTDSNVPQKAKANGAKEAKGIIDPELRENKEPTTKRTLKKQLPPQGKKLQSNLERTIESVVHNLRTPKVVLGIEKVAKKVAPSKVRRSTENSAKVVARRSSTKQKDVPQTISRIPRRSAQLRWSNGWRWLGDPFDGKVFLNSDESIVTRKCYPAMVHEEGDIIEPRDCVLLKAGQRKNELPFVAKIAALWENLDDGEMMMSLLWYYRPEHTEQGRRPVDQPDEVFASRHKDSNSVACIEDKCYVLTYNEYCRYRKDLRRLEACVEDTGPCIPQPDPYPRHHRQPPSTLGTSADLVFFCRKVYDFRQKRIIKNPS